MFDGEKNNIINKNNDSQIPNYGSTLFNGMADENGSDGTTMTTTTTAAEIGQRRRLPSSSRDHRVHFVNDPCGPSVLTLFDERFPATVANTLAALAAVAIAWCLLRVNVSPDLMALPGGSVASIFVLYVIGLAAGRATGALIGIPPLLGMMVAGIALQNCGLYTVTDQWCVRLVAIMREAALSVILIKGGLEMNPDQLRRLSGAVTRLALLPCIAEAVAAGVAAHYILRNFSWVWGLTLGFTLSAVSPAVLVPSLLRLKRMGYGEENGVNTLVIAASSLDDIVSISAFGVLLGVIFSTGNLTSKIVQGPEDVCIGTALGLVWGFVLIFVPPSPWAKLYEKNEGENEDNEKKQKNRETSVVSKRSFLLGAGGILAVTGSQFYGYPGAGPLACIISSFVAGAGWKWRAKEQNRNNSTTLLVDDDENQKREDPVEKVFERIWFGLQPVLFASIGTEVKFELLKGGDIVIAGLMVLVAGLIIRTIVTACSVWGAGFNTKEVIFINIAWLPKATVQAALAPVALDMARMMGSEEDKESASRLLTIAVISILVTAPIGAFGIQWFGPKLLSKSNR